MEPNRMIIELSPEVMDSIAQQLAPEHRFSRGIETGASLLFRTYMTQEPILFKDKSEVKV